MPIALIEPRPIMLQELAISPQPETSEDSNRRRRPYKQDTSSLTLSPGAAASAKLGTHGSRDWNHWSHANTNRRVRLSQLDYLRNKSDDTGATARALSQTDPGPMHATATAQQQQKKQQQRLTTNAANPIVQEQLDDLRRWQRTASLRRA